MYGGDRFAARFLGDALAMAVGIEAEDRDAVEPGERPQRVRAALDEVRHRLASVEGRRELARGPGRIARLDMRRRQSLENDHAFDGFEDVGHGDFRARYELHNYPFDTQQLLVHFRSTQQRQELVTYVIDRFGLRLADERSSLVDDGAYSGLELWRFLRLRYFVDSLSSGSTLGKAALFDSGLKMEFAGFDTVIVLRRSSAVFILKNLLPLFLLALVVLATLFFPETLFRERVTIPVTAMLTSAVLLLTIDNQLGDVGYTVAVEKIFYVFFALCLMVML